MWYRTWNHLMGYAVSGDGLHWQKPNLGYVEFAGDYDTNLVFDKYQCPSIVLDAQDQNPEKRFKMLYGGRGPLFKKATYQRGEANYGKHGVGLMVAYSPDGVRWWRDPHDVVWPYNLYMPGIPSDGLAVIYDRYKGKYAAYDCAKPRGSVHEEYVDRASDWGIDLIHDEGVVRQMIVSYSVDGLIWSEPVGVLAPDEEDRRRYGDRVQFYDLSVRLYEGIYVGYLWVWPIEPDWMQIELVTSRDGLHWKRVADRELFIRTGPKGTFDSHLIMGVSPSQWWKQLIFNELWAKKRPDRAAKSSIRRKRALMLALVKYKARPSHEKYCRTKLPASSPNSSHSMQGLHRVSGNNGAD